MVSIILPVYNVAEYIDRCLESIVVQDYRDLEIILIDDGSTDESPLICDKWSQKDSRVRTIHKKNAGVSEARNMGIELASGEFITFVDPDDYIENSLYSEVISYCKIYDIVGFGYNTVDNNGTGTFNVKCTSFVNAKTHAEIARMNYARIMGLNAEDVVRWNHGGHIGEKRAKGMVWQYIFSAKLLKENNIRFRTNIKLKEDEIFVMEALIYANSMMILPKPYYYYVERITSITHTISAESKLANKFALLNAKNDIRKLVIEREGLDLLWTYAASNVLSVLEVAIICVNVKNGYKKYMEYIQMDNVIKSVKMIPLQMKNPKFNILLFLMKLNMFRTIYIGIKVALKMGITAMPDNIL